MAGMSAPTGGMEPEDAPLAANQWTALPPVPDGADKMSAVMIDAGDFGSVLVVRGKHKGKTGYYDDDATEKSAIVYFGVPFVTPYTILPRSWLRKAPVASEQLEHFVRQHPDLAAQLGVPKR